MEALSAEPAPPGPLPSAPGGAARTRGGRNRGGGTRGGGLLQFARSYWVDIAWVVFIGLNLIAMRLLPAWQTVPFLIIWVSLTTIYGFRLWRLGSTSPTSWARPSPSLLATPSSSPTLPPIRRSPRTRAWPWMNCFGCAGWPTG